MTKDVDVWKEGSLVVTRPGTDLTWRCIKCGSADVMTRRVVQVHYFPKWTVVPVFAGFVFVRPFTVTVGLCNRHSSQFREDLKVNLPLVVLGIACLAGAWFSTSFLLLGLGLLLTFAGCLRSLLGADPVRLKSYKDPFVKLSGAGEPFLAGLAERAVSQSGV